MTAVQLSIRSSGVAAPLPAHQFRSCSSCASATVGLNEANAAITNNQSNILLRKRMPTLPDEMPAYQRIPGSHRRLSKFWSRFVDSLILRRGLAPCEPLLIKATQGQRML